jgi:AcrR family transcriptional regulator
MARRKDHTPEQLRTLIRSAAEKLIYHKGLDGLTARALAEEIGYTPGTIYNFYRDMDALVIDINFETLGHLYDLCQKRIENLPLDFSKVSALAYAYVDFAHENVRAWETVFAITYKGEKKVRLPKHYQARLLKLFSLIEFTLHECLKMPEKKARPAARLLWACLHGITVLTLDGRLSLIGIDDPHHMIDDLLHRYLAEYL